MPEYPEVNYQVRYLRARCRGWHICEFGWKGRGHFKNLPLAGREALLQRFFLGNVVEDITQKGKHVVMRTRRGAVLSHMMFKGRWSVDWDPFTSNYKQHKSVPDPRTVTFWMVSEDGQRLNFHTPDHKAYMTAHPGHKVPAEIRQLSRLGPEVLPLPETDQSFEGRWELEDFMASARCVELPIKVYLLDQKRQCGLGNMYVCEALYLAGVDPSRPAWSLSDEEFEAIWRSARKIMREAVDFFLDYEGLLSVYRRDTDRLGRRVSRKKVGGRDTFWVPALQH